MLLTPHIVRTHELTVDDLAPMYIGTQQNVGLSGPPQLIQPPLAEEAPAAQLPAQPGGDHDAGSAVPAATARDTGARDGRSAGGRGRAGPNAIHAAAGWCAAARSAPPATPGDRAASRPGSRTSHFAGDSRRVDRAGHYHGAAGVPHRRGPYTVPLAVANASRLSMVTLTVTFNPAVLRVRNVQEGTFMRQGGVIASLHAPHRCRHRTRGHRRHAQRRSGRRVRLGSAGGAALRCGRPGQLADSGERRGEQSRRRRASAAVHAGVGDGEVMP